MRMVKASGPDISRARAAKLPFHVSIAAWIDLLGYGSMIGVSGMNPIDPSAEEAVRRLRMFQRIVAEHSHRHYRTLVLNDGAVAYRDLSLRSDGPTRDFLQRSIALHRAVNAAESRAGWYGARMVVSVGLRAKGSRRAIDASALELGRILEEMAAGSVSAEEAVRRAAAIQRHSDQIPQLQANFAFSRAYVADDAGSDAGLGGPRLLVDTAMFIDGTPPRWILADDTIPFRVEKLGIDCTFAPVTGLEPTRGGEDLMGLRDGIAIGEVIAPTLGLRRMIAGMRTDTQ
jgi:hypothetical protein